MVDRAPERSARHAARRRPDAAWLDRARTVGDPAADVVVARLARTHDLAEVDAVLARLQSTDGPLPPSLPLPLRSFLAAEGLPPWADGARLLRAQYFAERHAVAVAAALFCASLPMAFTGAKGVSVLHGTGRIASDVDLRVNETGRFVFDVLLPGAFATGHAVRSAQKVRLLHASVRYRILAGARAGGPWSAREVPINQEDLLGTLFCFSVVVLDAIERMGVTVHAHEAEDFVHLWRVVGHLVGIQRERLPSSVAAARALGEAIHARQSRASPEGRALARFLLDGIERHLPARGLRVLAPGLMRYFLGDDAAQLLGLPQGMRGSDLGELLPAVTRLAQRATSGALGAAIPRAGRAVLELWMRSKLAGRTPQFQAPLEVAGGRDPALPSGVACPRSAAKPSRARRRTSC